MNSTRTSQHFFAVVPGVKDWELWRWSAGKSECVAHAESPHALRPSGEAVLCLPASEIAAAAIWLTTIDKAMVGEMAALQMEALFPRDSTDPVRAFHSIGSEESRTLVLAVNAPDSPVSLKDVRLVGGCVPAFCAFSFPPDSITVFRELGSLVAVVTRSSQPAGLLRLGTPTLNASAASELWCLVLRLMAESVIERMTKLTIWNEQIDPDFTARLQEYGITCAAEANPPPQLPESTFDLSPPQLVQARRRSQQAGTIRRAGVAALAVATALVLAWMGHYAWIEYEYHRLETANAAMHPEASKLKIEADQWNALEPTISPKLFALERLNQFAARLPANGVRLTLFRMDAKGILVTGEADRPAQVVEYQGGLAAAPELALLDLAMPPPKIMQDNIARFEILGTRKGVSHGTP